MFPHLNMLKTYIKKPGVFILIFLICFNKCMCLGSAGLGERCCVYQWVEPWALLVHWPPADSLPPRSFSQQWNQSGITVQKQMMNYDDCCTLLVCVSAAYSYIQSPWMHPSGRRTANFNKTSLQCDICCHSMIVNSCCWRL